MADDAGAPSALLARVLSALESAGLSATLLEHGAVGADKGADLEVRLGSARFLHDVKVRSRVTAESAMALPPRQGARALMVVPRVPAAVAEVWRANDVHFVDGVGNAYLRQPGLLLDVRGRREAPQFDGSGVPARWSRPAGQMVVFALLCEPGLAEAPLREIAAAGSQASGVLVYAPELPRALIVEHRLRKAADDGDVEFRRLFWAFSGSQGLVAPSPLVYADLIASGDPRLAAAARELRETDGVLRRLDRS